MLTPVDLADLVLDQGIGGLVIGDAQQSLGKAHQRDAFFGVEPILLQECVDPAGLMRTCALDQVDCQFCRRLTHLASGRGLRQTLGDASILLCTIGTAKLAAIKILSGVPGQFW